MTEPWRRYTEQPWEVRNEREVFLVEPGHAGHLPIPTLLARSMVHADGLAEYIVRLHNAALAAQEAPAPDGLHGPWCVQIGDFTSHGDRCSDTRTYGERRSAPPSAPRTP